MAVCVFTNIFFRGAAEEKKFLADFTLFIFEKNEV
jgi:hypothetical protein